MRPVSTFFDIQLSNSRAVRLVPSSALTSLPGLSGSKIVRTAETVTADVRLKL